MNATSGTMARLQATARGQDDTARLGAMLASVCGPGDCIVLQGDLGAGKTTFARGFIGALCPNQEEIVSPTFSLVQTYETDSGVTLAHFDLYRVLHAQELAEIGFEDALHSGMTLVEWPDVARHLLPVQTLEITIAMPDAESRALTFAGEARAWQERLAAMEACV